MKKLAYIVTVSLLILIACTIVKKDMVMEALKAEGFDVTKSDNFYSLVKLDAATHIGYYNLGSNMKISVYDFGSKEKQELGYTDFKKQRESMNMVDPPVIQIDKYFVIATPSVTEEYQKKIQKALNGIQ